MASGTLTPPPTNAGHGEPGGAPGDPPFGTPGHGGVRNNPDNFWINRFDNHPVRFLMNHPGKVATIQKMMRDTGFNITVDGQMGPQTRHAARAYVNGVSGRHWSQNNPFSNSNRNPANPPGNPPNNPPRNPPKNPPKTGPEHVPKAPSLSKEWILLNPKKYARDEVNVKFRPILAQLAGQLNTQTAQGKQNLADLTHWYNQIRDQAEAAATTDAATAGSAQQAADNFRATLLNAIGGGAAPGAGEAAAFADITSTGQRNLAQSQSAFDANRQASLVSQAASAQTQQLRMDQNKLTAIQQQQTQALQSRGDEYALDLQNAQILRNSQLAGKQAASQQDFTNKLTRQTQGRNLRQQDLTNAGLGKELAKNGVGGQKGMSIMNDPNARGKLSQSVYNQLLVPIDKPGHGAPYSPKEAWLQMAQILNTATGNGPGTNAKVFRLSVQIYREYVGQFVQWYNNKTVKGRKNPVTVDQYLSDNNTPWPRSVWVNRRGVKWA